MRQMMDSVFDCGISGWLGMALMSGIGFLLLLVLLLAIVGLGRYVITGSIG